MKLTTDQPVELQSIKCVADDPNMPPKWKFDVMENTDSSYGSLDHLPEIEKDEDETKQNYTDKELQNGLKRRNLDLENDVVQQETNHNQVSSTFSHKGSIYPKDSEANDSIENNNDNDDEDDDEHFEKSKFAKCVKTIQDSVSKMYKNNEKSIWTAIWILLLILYFAYFGYAMYFRFGDEASIRLLVCTIIGSVGLVMKLVLGYCGKRESGSHESNTVLKSISSCMKSDWVYRGIQLVIVIFAVVYIIVDVAVPTPRNLISLAGLIFFVVSFYIFSHNPARVNWRPVFWGLAIQFIFALLILRWNGGYNMFKWLGDRVTEFLAYTDAGSKFVFGDEYKHHFFAFKVLTTVVFFSTTISVLYYLEVMQFIIRNIARFMAMVMGTSATESLNAAGNIFIGQSESPLLIRPFIKDMTSSELHAVCTGGFATIAGSVMAAYILYGVPANHLLSASVMSAPAALAMSKLFYPETKKSKTREEDVYKMEKGSERNLIEAASVGASQSIKLVANIAVNLIAFIAILEFVNTTLTWFGARVGLEEPGYENLTFQLICSYVFWPVAFLMGVETVDCRKVAELIGVKTFVNEFVAYTELSVYINNQKNLTWYEGLVNTTSNSTNLTYTGAWYYNKGDIVYDDLNITLVGGLLQERSVVIATYALCGFSNIGSIGVMLGALGAMAPSRRSDISKVVMRAMIAGNVACFMTACIAGLLYTADLG